MNFILNICLAMISSEDEQEKFELIYRTYFGLMMHRAKEFLQDEKLAEDAVSIAFMKIAQNMHKVDEATSPRTKSLLLRVVERSAINLYHQQQRQWSRTTTLEDVGDMVQYPQQEERIADAILELPEQYKGVLLLKYADGYGNKEIAELLGYSVTKVDQLISRGKKLLWVKLSEA